MAKRAGDRKRQTKINFSPAAKLSPSAASMGAGPSKSATDTPTKASRSTPRKFPGPRRIVVDMSSDDELAGETYRSMSMGMPVTTTEHGMFGSSDKEAESSATEQDEEEVERKGYAKLKLASRKRQRSQVDSESEDEKPTRKGKGQAKVTVARAKRTRRRSPDSDSSEDEELRVPPSKRIKVTKRQRTPSEDEDKDEESEPLPPRSQRRKRARQQSPSDKEEVAPPASSRRRNLPSRQREPDVIEQSTPPRSARRKIKRRPATPSDEEEDENEQDVDASDDDVQEADDGASAVDDESEIDDIQEDLAFLKSSPMADRGKLRSAHEKPKSQRQKALEALKRKRAGTNEPSSSATPARSRPVLIESESESELESIKEEPESGVEVDSDAEGTEDGAEAESDRDANALDMFLEDEEDGNFLDDDVDAVIAEPILQPDDFMPLILQRIASSKPKELFKYAIEWMVMKKIHPAFESNNQIYTTVFRKLDDEVKGLANSKFSSSSWTIDFTRAIRARPDLMSMDISVGKSEVMEMHCEACNRRNHPASAELMFTGQPYNAETLEPIDNDSDSGSDSDSDNMSELSEDPDEPKMYPDGKKAAYNATGERLPPESRRFALGRTCRANAQVAHTLHHWRYHLYSWVKDYLALHNHLTAEMLVKRDSWSDRKREKAALKIVKTMEADGEIKKLYHLYKEQVTYAVDVRHDLESRWARR